MVARELAQLLDVPELTAEQTDEPKNGRSGEPES